MQNNFNAPLAQKKGLVQVELSYQQETIYRNTDLDPQNVIARQPHASEVILSTLDLPDGVPRNDFVISNNIQYLSNASRIAPKQAEFENYFIPNVNPRNNNIVFFSSVSGTQHSVFVPEGYYDNATTLSTVIRDTLNTVTGASGLTFTVSPELTNFPRAFQLNSAGGTFYIVNTCSAVTRGKTVWALGAEQVLSSNHSIGPMSLQYTWWIDITSSVLTKYAKMRSITSSARGNIFARMGLNDQFREIPWGNVYDSFDKEDITYAFKPMEVVTSIDIQLYDMWGDLLYIPPDLIDKLIFNLQFKAVL